MATFGNLGTREILQGDTHGVSKDQSGLTLVLQGTVAGVVGVEITIKVVNSVIGDLGDIDIGDYPLTVAITKD